MSALPSAQGEVKRQRECIMEIHSLRQELKEEFEREADWRREKAVEYPEDERNLESAAEYDRLAATVDVVPDELIVAYRECFDDERDVELHQELMKSVFHCGAPPSATEFLKRFISRVNLGEEPDNKRK